MTTQAHRLQRRVYEPLEFRTTADGRQYAAKVAIRYVDVNEDYEGDYSDVHCEACEKSLSRLLRRRLSHHEVITRYRIIDRRKWLRHEMEDYAGLASVFGPDISVIEWPDGARSWILVLFGLPVKHELLHVYEIARRFLEDQRANPELKTYVFSTRRSA